MHAEVSENKNASYLEFCASEVKHALNLIFLGFVGRREPRKSSHTFIGRNMMLRIEAKEKFISLS